MKKKEHDQTPVKKSGKNIGRQSIARNVLCLFMVFFVLLSTFGCRKANQEVKVPQLGQTAQQILENVQGPYDAEVDEKITTRLSDAVEPIENEDGTCTSQEQYDEALEAAKEAAEELQQEGLVSYLETSAGYVYVKDAQGIGTVYVPEVPGIAEAGDGVSIYSFEPCRAEFLARCEDYPEFIQWEKPDKITNMVKKAAKKAGLDMEEDLCLHDQQVTLESVLKLHKNSVIVWDGHGKLFDSVGPTLKLDIRADSQLINRYYEEFQTEQVIKGEKNDCIWVTPKFFEEHFGEGDLDNTVIFLCTCHGLQDERLAETLRSKGATLVIGFTESVRTIYAEDIMETFLERFSQGDSGYDCLQYITWNKQPYDHPILNLFTHNEATYEFYGDLDVTIDSMKKTAVTGVAHPTGAPACISDFLGMTYEEILNAVAWNETEVFLSNDYSETELWTLRAITDTVIFEFTFQGVMQDASAKPVRLNFYDKNLGQSRIIHITESIENGMTYDQISRAAEVSELEEILGTGGVEYRIFKCLTVYDDTDLTLYLQGDSPENAILYQAYFETTGFYVSPAE